MPGRFFKTNRNTPEAQANQLEWARKQMDLEMPDATLTGDSISDRSDFIAKYSLGAKLASNFMRVRSHFQQ